MEIKFLMMEKIKEDEMFPFLLFPSANLHFHLKTVNFLTIALKNE